MGESKESAIGLRNSCRKIVQPLALVLKKFAIVDVASFGPCWVVGKSFKGVDGAQ